MTFWKRPKHRDRYQDSDYQGLGMRWIDYRGTWGNFWGSGKILRLHNENVKTYRIKLLNRVNFNTCKIYLNNHEI